MRGGRIPSENVQVPEIADVIPKSYRAGIEINLTRDNDRQDFDLVSGSRPTQEAKP